MNAEKAVKWGVAIVVIFGILNAFYLFKIVVALKITLPVLCIFLIGSILLQSGKGGGLAAIGGLGDQSAFGTKTGTFLSKITYLLGAAFIVTTV
ncbi:MAG TPA: preprotein translocase subunit SecG, partial [Candidatus Wujingus californicus]